jgi:MYXO-CTERM domain-containing protein
MNDVPYWLDHRPEMEMLFNQEIGHRFGVFVEADLGDGPTNLLLGRSADHWSYFFHTRSSPMEGNAWIDHGDGSFTTATVPNAIHYHSLDLYLMGLVPPEDVEPTFLIRNVSDAGVDCLGFPVHGGSVPQFCDPPKTVRGERVDVGVEHILAVEGPRSPAWPDTPDRFEVAFVLLADTPAAARDEGLLRGLDVLLGAAVSAFRSGTDGLAELEVVTGTPGGLDDLEVEAGCGCRLGGTTARRVHAWVVVLALFAARRRR